MDKWTEGEAVQPKEREKKEKKEEQEDKPSRLWIFYHFWAAFCVKLYIDVSGFSQYVLGSLSGSDRESASNYAEYSTILLVVLMILGYLLSKALVTSIDGWSITSKAKFFLKSILPIAYFASAILLSVATAPLFAVSEDAPKSLPSNHQESGLKSVIAFTTVQSSEGFTEADLDQAFLINIENWILGTMFEKIMNAYPEMGYDPEDLKSGLSARSVYMIVSGKKFAIIKIDLDNYARFVTIVGIEGPEFYRVTCLRPSNHDIPVWSGECGNEVKNTFGVSIEP